MTTRLRCFWDDDSGVALFTVLGIILLMTLAAVSAWYLAQQATLQSTRLKSTQEAFQAANAGVDIALARMQSHGYSEGDFPITGNIGATSATYETSVAPQANSAFLCTSRGVDRLGRVQIIRVKFFYFSLWNMEIANAGGVSNPSGGAVVGNTSVFGPLYCRGTVNLSGSSNIDVGPLMVNYGSIVLGGSGSVGSTTYGAIDVYVSGASPAVGSKNYYTTSVSNSVPNISLPLVDANELGARFNDARNQSADNKRGDGYSGDPVNQECDPAGDGSTYTTVNPPNNGTTWYGSGTTTNRLTAPGTAANFYKAIGAGTVPVPGSPTGALTIDGSKSWGTWPGDGHTASGSPGDDFAYDASTHTLYVWGVVYVDGPINFSTDIYYVGNGTLVANGDITGNALFLPKTSATATLTANQMDAQHCVGLVTPYDIQFDLTGGTAKTDPYGIPDVCGAFFAGGSFIISGHPLVKGSILANTIDFVQANNAHLVTEPRLPSFLPAGMPAAGQSLLYKGSWARQ